MLAQLEAVWGRSKIRHEPAPGEDFPGRFKALCALQVLHARQVTLDPTVGDSFKIVP